MKEKSSLYARFKKSIRREIFGRYLTKDERRQLSPEWKARLEEAERLEYQSNIALILAIIALIVSCIR